MYFYCSVFALLALFFAILVFALQMESYSFMTVRAGNDKNIEARLRLLMLKNPRSEIVVINNSSLFEISEILRKMQYDFPRVHIVSY